MERLQELFELLTGIEIGSYSDPFRERTGEVSGWTFDSKEIVSATCSVDKDYCTLVLDFPNNSLKLMQHDTHDIEDDDRYAGDFPIEREDGSLEVVYSGGPSGGEHIVYCLERI